MPRAPRATKAPVEEVGLPPEGNGQPPVVETDEQPKKAVAETKQATFMVLNSYGNPIRTYEGPDAEANAHEYAKKIGGKVL